MPTTPQQLDGLLIDPPASEPSASGHRQAASAAADPPLEPPAVLLKSQGLRVAGKRAERGGCAVAELGCVRLAKEHPAGFAQASGDGRIARWHIVLAQL